jgi:S-phase kinase-associated protein 1
MQSNNTVTLVSGDNQEFVVDLEIAQMSNTIREMLKDLNATELKMSNGTSGSEAAGTKHPIHLPYVASRELKRVIEFSEKFLHQYRSEGKPLPPEDIKPNPNMKFEPTEWQKEFLKMDYVTEGQILHNAVNNLDHKYLFHFLCQYVADVIKTMDVPQIREFLGIVNDFTPEEEEQIRKENEWVSDEPVKADEQSQPDPVTANA